MSEVLGPEISYVDLLNVKTRQAAAMEEEAIAQGAQPPYNPLRPSSAGKCTRELAYSLMEFTKQTYYPKEVREPNVTRLLSVGHFLEDQLIQQFEKFIGDYFKVKYKQHSVEGFEVTSKKYEQVSGVVEGSIDWCFWSPETRGLIDAKTKKDKFHQHYRTDWEATTEKLKDMRTVETIGNSDKGFWIEDVDAFLAELKDPFWEQNFFQTNFYANTDWAKRKGIDHVSLIYYSKNDSRLREIRFKPSAALYEKTRAKFQEAVDACDEGDPTKARRDYQLGSIKCAFCPYSKQCWGSKSDALGDYFETFPKKKWPKDTAKLKKVIADSFELLYNDFIATSNAAASQRETEDQILRLMEEHNISRIRFKDNKIYERKLYKSPRQHYRLKRTKL